MKKTNDSNNIVTFKETTISTVLKELLQNKSINENEYNYLKENQDKSTVLKSIATIANDNIKSISLEFESQKININNLTPAVKNLIKKVVNKENLKIQSKLYHEVAENKATNSIIKSIAKKHKNDDFLFGNLELNVDDSKIKIKGISKTKTSTNKFLDFLMMSYVLNGRSKKTMKIHLNEYLKLRGKEETKNTIKEIRKEINEALELIKNISISFTSEKRNNHLHMSLYGGTSGIVNNIIHFNFNNDFLEYLDEIPKQFMYIHKEIFTFNDKYNPHSYYLLRRACLHKRMNFGKSNENIIGMKTLLDYCPKFTAYQNYEQLQTKKFSQWIIEPFEKDMDIITAFSWEYLGNQPTTFNKLLSKKIQLTWNDYPNIKLENFKKTIKNSSKK